MTTYKFAVTGMHCPSCGLLIDETLEELPGVRSSQTSVRSGHTVVELDLFLGTEEEVVKAINEAGYQAERVDP